MILRKYKSLRGPVHFEIIYIYIYIYIYVCVCVCVCVLFVKE